MQFSALFERYGQSKLQNVLVAIKLICILSEIVFGDNTSLYIFLGSNVSSLFDSFKVSLSIYIYK